jgi:preprotein translocase subunit SecD
LVTCDREKTTKFILGPVELDGTDISKAVSAAVTTSNGAATGSYAVDLTFTDAGGKKFGDVTGRLFPLSAPRNQFAVTIDGYIVTAPAIQAVITAGTAQITGDFNQESADNLANQLKYGSLPLSFESSEAETVSATLGLTSLRAGLIAGGIGLAMVLLYSLLYYRVLGLLTALSLVASGAMVFAILVLLGRYINYTLDLAGIAGLIIGIGTTADSFVVFFERIKDEIREGRSFRSAVPRGWARARKTILSGNAVSFLAAAVLYFLAVGQVKGFAFTLGLTTILDVLVVFTVTWPLVYLASKSPTMSKPALNGLGAVQRIARERREAGQSETLAAAERG